MSHYYTTLALEIKNRKYKKKILIIHILIHIIVYGHLIICCHSSRSYNIANPGCIVYWSPQARIYREAAVWVVEGRGLILVSVKPQKLQLGEFLPLNLRVRNFSKRCVRLYLKKGRHPHPTSPSTPPLHSKYSKTQQEFHGWISALSTSTDRCQCYQIKIDHV